MQKVEQTTQQYNQQRLQVCRHVVLGQELHLHLLKKRQKVMMRVVEQAAAATNLSHFLVPSSS